MTVLYRTRIDKARYPFQQIERFITWLERLSNIEEPETANLLTELCENVEYLGTLRIESDGGPIRAVSTGRGIEWEEPE